MILLLITLCYISSINIISAKPCKNCELHAAVSSNDLHAVKKYIIHNTNINQPDKQGKTPLHYSSINNYIEITKLLLDIPNIDINQPDNEGYTPLHYSTINNHLETNVMLLKLPNINVNFPSQGGQTALYTAAKTGNVQILSNLLSANADPTLLTKKGSSILHAAAYSGNPDVLKSILLASQEVRQNVNIPSPSTGHTPLQTAAIQGNIDNVKLLLTRDGGFIDCNVRVTTTGATALIYATTHNSLETVTYLLDHCYGIDVDAETSDGWTSFMMAARTGNKDILKALMNAKSTASAKKDLMNHVSKHNHQTALIVAAHNNQFEIVLWLLQQDGIEPDRIVDQGWNALFAAIEIGNSDIVRELLVSKKVNARAIRSNGWSILHQACFNGKYDIVRSIFKYVNTNIINLESLSDHHTPLSLSLGHLNIVKLLIRDGRCELNYKIQGKQGSTALMLASKAGYLDVVKLLSNDKRVDISEKNNFALTALDIARKNNRHEVEKFLSLKERMKEL